MANLFGLGGGIRDFDPTFGKFGDITRKYNLPELGISEALGGDRNSTYMKPAVSSTVTPGSTRSFGPEVGKVAGVSTTGSGSTQPLQSQQLFTPASQADMDGKSSKEQGYDAGSLLASQGIDKSQKKDFFGAFGVDNTPDLLKELDKVYSQTLGYADKAEDTLKSQFGSATGDLERLTKEREALLGQQRQEGASQLDLQAQEGEQRKANALTEAARLYNELTQGGRQRFGGSSSAGDAYQAIAGQEMQRNRQAIVQDFSNFMQQVSFAKQNLQQQYSVAIQNLQSEKQRLINEARRDFQNKLLEIDRMRAGASSDKANARLQVLQDLRNQQFQIDLATQQNQMAVQAQFDSISQALEQQAVAKAQELEQMETYSPEMTMQRGVDPIPADNSMAFTGRISDEEYPIGAVNPLRRDEFGLV